MSDVVVQDSVVAAPPTAGASGIRERVVVAPTAGKFRQLPPEEFTSEGEWVEPGQIIAAIDRGNEVVPVRCPFRGWVMGDLAMQGQPVGDGEALFWIWSS